MAEKNDAINGTLRSHGFFWRNSTGQRLLQIRVGKSPDLDKVIESLELLKDPPVFHDALQIASSAFDHDQNGLHWRDIVVPQIKQLSRSSARLAAVIAQLGLTADAAVGPHPSVLLTALASAKATAEAQVLQAVSRAKKGKPPGRPRIDKDTQIGPQPSIKQIARLFGRHLDVSQSSSAQGSAPKRQASLSFVDQDGQNDAIAGGSGAPAVKRMRRRKPDAPSNSGSSHCDVFQERGRGIPIQKQIEIYDFIKDCPSNASVGKLVLNKFKETLKWGSFSPGRLVKKCELLKYKDMPEEMKKGCLVPNWWKEQLGDPSLRMMGRSPHWNLPLDLQRQLDTIHCQRAVGAKSGVNEIVPLGALAKEAQKMASMYNQKAEIENERRREINAQTLRLASSGALDLREAKARHIPMVKLAKGSFSKKWASRFRKKWGFSHRTVNTAGIYMPYDHPYMVASRAAEERRISKEHIYRQLFLIYDQLWKKVYRGKKKKAHKPAQFCGMRTSRNLRLSQKRAVEKARLPGRKRGFAEVDSELKDRFGKLRQFAQEEDTRVDPVFGQRGGARNDRLHNLYNAD